jgi:hypothetical protein
MKAKEAFEPEHPFALAKSTSRPLAKKLGRRLRRLSRIAPDRVPVLIVGKGRRRFAVLELFDCTFLPPSLTK